MRESSTAGFAVGDGTQRGECALRRSGVGKGHLQSLAADALLQSSDVPSAITRP